MPHMLTTPRVLHALAQVGYKAGTPAGINAADSIVSLMALNLKKEQVVVPPEMMRYYRTLKAIAGEE